MSKDRWIHRGAEDSRGLMRRLQSGLDRVKARVEPPRVIYDIEADGHELTIDEVDSQYRSGKNTEIELFPQAHMGADNNWPTDENRSS